MIRFLAALALTVLAAASSGVGVGADAGEARLDGPLVQGGLVRGFVAPGARVRLDGRALRVSANGLFVVGFGRDAGRSARLEIRHADGTSETRELKIARREYQVQRIDGLPGNMVSPSAADLVRIRAEGARIAAVRRRNSVATWFAGGFDWPLRGIVTGVYGSQRILNGEPRRPHYGVDIAAPVGTPVSAPGAGAVALAEPDLFFTGGTVMIDHGHGLTTVLSHLSRVDVNEGERVAKGQVVGAVGATGRATGAHLDWRVNWFKARLDPALLVGPMAAE